MGYLDFTFVTENRCKVVFFLNHYLKSAFLKHNCNKTSTKIVYELYEYLEQKIMIKDKDSMLFGRNPFLNKNNTLNDVIIARNSI